MRTTKFIVVTGGVMSGVGKGIATASLAKILQTHGFTVTTVKIDPYINLNAGTLRPTEHGEVWVTDDGGEIDQDLGNYERFLNIPLPKKNCMTTGQIYKAVIDQEINGDFLGETVQFIPHIPNEIKRRVLEAAKNVDFCLIEIGGTVGDYDNIPFLFAMKSLERERPGDILYFLVTYLPIPDHMPEMKTKPTQMAIKLLTEHGIFPDFILCRAREPLDQQRKKKIETYANIGAEYVISAPDLKKTIYAAPLNFEREHLGEKILKKLGLQAKAQPDWTSWQELVRRLEQPEHVVKIAMVCKYVDSGNYHIADSYISVNEALKHAGASFHSEVQITWLDAKDFETHPETITLLDHFDGIIVPGGFGNSGVEGKMLAIQYAREHQIPFLGLCYGMQLAIIEAARHLCGFQGAHTTEVDPRTPYPVIDMLPEQRAVKEKSGSMRLGAYGAALREGSIVLSLYQNTGRLARDQQHIASLRDNNQQFRLGKTPLHNMILERHRHRYEQNPQFIQHLERVGFVFSGYHERVDGTKLMEFLELKKEQHPFFVGTQSHPCFKSTLLDPAPLYVGFVEAALQRQTHSPQVPVATETLA